MDAIHNNQGYKKAHSPYVRPQARPQDYKTKDRQAVLYAEKEDLPGGARATEASHRHSQKQQSTSRYTSELPTVREKMQWGLS